MKSTNQTLNHSSSLFWADDIVLLSESEEGLRKMLKTMEKYCEENELTLNTDKTKCIIFNKTGRLLRTPFTYNNTKLENEDLRDRALKGFFKLKNDMGDTFHTNIKITLHLFDLLIKPIIMYMSGFWGGMKAPKEKDKPIQIFHHMACNHILGVQKQTTNIGVLLELGRVPLQNYAIKSAIENWERIERGKINTVLMKIHHDAIHNELPWITNINSILQSYELDTIHRDECQRRKHPFIHKILHQK